MRDELEGDENERDVVRDDVEDEKAEDKALHDGGEHFGLPNFSLMRISLNLPGNCFSKMTIGLPLVLRIVTDQGYLRKLFATLFLLIATGCTLGTILQR